MFIHSVYFWLRDDLSPDEVQRFEKGVRMLTRIKSVRYGWVGRPAGTDRAIIDRSYTYSLTVVFDAAPAHDAYQVDPVHDDFRKAFDGYWKDIKIYDAISTEYPE